MAKLLDALVRSVVDFEAMPVIEDGQITRIYAVTNPHKLARLDEEPQLSR